MFTINLSISSIRIKGGSRSPFGQGRESECRAGGLVYPGGRGMSCRTPCVPRLQGYIVQDALWTLVAGGIAGWWQDSNRIILLRVLGFSNSWDCYQLSFLWNLNLRLFSCCQLHLAILRGHEDLALSLCDVDVGGGVSFPHNLIRTDKSPIPLFCLSFVTMGLIICRRQGWKCKMPSALPRCITLSSRSSTTSPSYLLKEVLLKNLGFPLISFLSCHFIDFSL